MTPLVDTDANSLEDLLARAPGAWSAAVELVGASSPILMHHETTPLRTASSAKVLLLVAIASEIEHGSSDPSELLRRSSVAPVYDSGMWQFLRQETLPLEDVAMLVGAVSDNWATNVLIERVGGTRWRCPLASVTGY